MACNCNSNSSRCHEKVEETSCALLARWQKQQWNESSSLFFLALLPSVAGPQSSPNFLAFISNDIIVTSHNQLLIHTFAWSLLPKIVRLSVLWKSSKTEKIMSLCSDIRVFIVWPEWCGCMMGMNAYMQSVCSVRAVEILLAVSTSRRASSNSILIQCRKGRDWSIDASFIRPNQFCHAFSMHCSFIHAFDLIDGRSTAIIIPTVQYSVFFLLCFCFQKYPIRTPAQLILLLFCLVWIVSPISFFKFFCLFS